MRVEAGFRRINVLMHTKWLCLHVYGMAARMVAQMTARHLMIVWTCFTVAQSQGSHTKKSLLNWHYRCWVSCVRYDRPTRATCVYIFNVMSTPRRTHVVHLVAFSGVDNCQGLVNICQNGGICVTTAVSYRCLCPEGYTGLNCQSGMMTRP